MKLLNRQLQNTDFLDSQGIVNQLNGFPYFAAGAYFWLCYGVGSVMGLGPLYLISELKAEQWHIGNYRTRTHNKKIIPVVLNQGHVTVPIS